MDFGVVQRRPKERAPSVRPGGARQVSREYWAGLGLFGLDAARRHRGRAGTRATGAKAVIPRRAQF